jgi:MiaB-like tRNA modifying enzyme
MYQKFYLESYGCSANIADSEIISGILRQGNYTLIDTPENADVNIIVTCSVKSTTSNRMLFRIKKLASLNIPLVVAGCMVRTERNLIENINSDASLLGPEDLEKTLDSVSFAIQGKRTINILGSLNQETKFPRDRKNPIIGIVKISSGCIGKCSFCQVKIAKGSLRSYSVDSIISEITDMIRDGCREIWLTSQDNGCYGRDIEESLPKLLTQIVKIKEQFKIRLGMMNPEHAHHYINDLTTIYKDPKFFKFIHMPVQSGSDYVLKQMNRNHTVRDFINSARIFKSQFPFSTLSTDIIVGFPTESEKDFDRTVEMLEYAKPDIVNISRFGSRFGTESATLTPLDSKIVRERSRTLHHITKQISLRNNKEWIGWSGEVLVDEKVKNAFIARNFAYKPVLIREELPIGKIVFVKIIDVSSNCLIAELN